MFDKEKGAKRESIVMGGGGEERGREVEEAF